MTPAFDYNYIIRDTDGVIRWEKRGNHRFLPIASDSVVYHDWLFEAETDFFMGAGTSAVLDMIYTDRSLCRFAKSPNLKILIDWTVQANLFLIQLEPVQDANFSFGPEEMPPDRQVSAFAFDSIYLALHEIGDASETASKVAGECLEIARLKMWHLRAAYERSIRRAGDRRWNSGSSSTQTSSGCCRTARGVQSAIDSRRSQRGRNSILRQTCCAASSRCHPLMPSSFTRGCNIIAIASSRTQRSTESRSRTH
jgi:hypothetical protein